MSAPLELERFELERLGAAVVVTTGVTTVVTTTCEVLVPETKLEVVTRVEGEEVVMTVLDAEVEEVVEVGVLEVEEEVEDEVEVVVGVEATGVGKPLEVERARGQSRCTSGQPLRRGSAKREE